MEKVRNIYCVVNDKVNDWASAAIIVPKKNGSYRVCLRLPIVNQ